MKRKSAVILIMIMLMNFCTGCLFLPDEEGNSEVLIQKEKEKVTVATNEVMQGDLVNEKSYEVRYSAATTSSDAFRVNGENVTKISVTLGSKVKKGQVLMSTDVAEYEEKLDEYEKTLRQSQLEVQHLQKLMKVAKSKEEKKQYASQISEARGSLQVNQIYVNETKAEIRKRQVIASTNGVVSYIRDYKDGATTKDGQNAVSISSTKSNFTSNDEYNPIMKVGKKVKIRIVDPDTEWIDDGKGSSIQNPNPKYYEYNAKVSKVERIRKRAEVTYELEPGVGKIRSYDSGKAVFSAKVLKNVTYIREKSVVVLNKKTYVYLVDNQMFRTLQPVKTGAVVGDYVVIKEGLEKGQKIAAG